MLFNRILVPLDGSDGARNATRMALALASDTGASVVAVHVLPPPIPDVAYTGLGTMGMPAPFHSEPRPPGPAEDRALIAARAAADDAGVGMLTRQVVDHRPADAIAEAAGQYHCDLIVMSSRSHGGLIAALTGGVSAGVFQRCDVPLLLVH